MLNAHNVRTYLEIGARHGDTFHIIMSSLPKGSFGIALDLGGGPWGVANSIPYLSSVIADLNKQGYNCDYILGDSTDPDIIETVCALGPYDAIFIDGDHRYNGVKSDWLSYGRVGKLVAFHDIVGIDQFDKQGNKVEVSILWNEIKERNKYTEFIGDKTTMGIGVILQ